MKWISIIEELFLRYGLCEVHFVVIYSQSKDPLFSTLFSYCSVSGFQVYLDGYRLSFLENGQQLNQNLAVIVIFSFSVLLVTRLDFLINNIFYRFSLFTLRAGTMNTQSSTF